jgi:hypothetical protein
VTLFDFLHQNPWWGLTYLILLITCIATVAVTFRKDEPPKDEPPTD